MKVQIQLFGRVAEAVGQNKLEISDFKGLRVNDLRSHVEEKYPSLRSITYKIAVNKKLVSENVELTEIIEVAFLPPFAGG